MTGRLRLSVSAVALAVLMSGGVSSAQAADMADPGCTIAGSAMAGYMYNWQDASLDIGLPGFPALGGADWDTPFGEGAGLATCGGFNIQADIAYYAHSADMDNTNTDFDQTSSHLGGALFYRDPASWAGGVQASWISQDLASNDIDLYRIGLFGEIYLGDAFALGASGHYYNNDDLAGKNEDGFELAAWGRFYATPDFSLLLRGDVLLADRDMDFNAGVAEGDFDGFAIAGEAEYLVWDQGLSLFAGARYAERTLEIDDQPTPGPPGVADMEFAADDFQVFAGIKFYFGQQGTLIERQRTGTIDNTSVFNEKLPNLFSSVLAASPGM